MFDWVLNAPLREVPLYYCFYAVIEKIKIRFYPCKNPFCYLFCALDIFDIKKEIVDITLVCLFVGGIRLQILGKKPSSSFKYHNRMI